MITYLNEIYFNDIFNLSFETTFNISKNSINNILKESDYNYELLKIQSINESIANKTLDSSAKGKINKAAKDIIDDVKKNGCNEETRKSIHGRIAKLFDDLSDSISKQASILYKSKSTTENQKKIIKACLLCSYVGIINSLCDISLSIIVGSDIAEKITVILVAPLVEESAKIISIKGGYSKEYFAVFNSGEFVQYMAKGYNMIEAYKRLGGQNAPTLGNIARMRVGTIGMHGVNTLIHKLFNDKVKDKNDKKETQDAKDKATLISFVIGCLIHGTWNTFAEFSVDFNNFLAGYHPEQ